MYEYETDEQNVGTGRTLSGGPIRLFSLSYTPHRDHITHTKSNKMKEETSLSVPVLAGGQTSETGLSFCFALSPCIYSDRERERKLSSVQSVSVDSPATRTRLARLVSKLVLQYSVTQRIFK